jgi:hypothetical protein
LIEISGSHGCDVKMITFWDVAPYDLIEVDRRFGGAYCLSSLFALMMEAGSSSETSVNLYQ